MCNNSSIFEPRLGGELTCVIWSDRVREDFNWSIFRKPEAREVKCALILRANLVSCRRCSFTIISSSAGENGAVVDCLFKAREGMPRNFWLVVVHMGKRVLP